MAISMSTLVGGIVFWVSFAYIVVRFIGLWIRVRRARKVYPCVLPPDFVEPRFFGALLGGAVGDALGLPAENLPRWLLRLRYPSGPALRRGIVRFVRHAGDISDDTQLAIAVARSISPVGTYDHERFRQELRDWFRFRVAAGRATTTAARRLRANTGESAASTSEGNGACTRVAALALVHAKVADDRLLLRDVEQNTRETHTTPITVAASKFVALLVRASLNEPAGVLADARHFDEIVQRLAERSGFPIASFESAKPGATLHARLHASGTSGHVLQTVTAALLVVRQHPTDFAAAMRAVFFAGGDVDSIGALVGTILGANLGFDAIPSEWRPVDVHDYLATLSVDLEKAAGAMAASETA